MNRLTKKMSGYSNGTKVEYVEVNSDLKCIDRLGQLEDLEEELGVDLIVLFKAFKNGIWTKGTDYGDCYLDAKPKFVDGDELNIGIEWYVQYDSESGHKNKVEDYSALCIFAMHWEEVVYCTRLKDYGKTWALTKEELDD